MVVTAMVASRLAIIFSWLITWIVFSVVRLMGSAYHISIQSPSHMETGSPANYAAGIGNISIFHSSGDVYGQML
jgi:hypothetical protein